MECSTLDARALVGPAGGREGVDLVEDDDRGRGLARLTEHPPQVLLRLAHPLRLELRARDDVDRRVHGGRDGLGEEGLPGAGRAIEDDAAREQVLDLLHVGLGLRLVLGADQIDELLPQALLHRLVAADVLLEVDVGQVDVALDRRLADLSVDLRVLRPAGRGLAPQRQRLEDLAAAHRVQAGDVLVEPEGIELLVVHRARLALGDDLRQRVARHADDLALDGEVVRDDLRQLEARVAEPEDARLRVLVEERDGLLGLGRERAVRRGQHVEVQQADDAALHRAADGVGELLQHAPEVRRRLALDAARPAVDDDQARRVLTAAQPLPDAHEEVERELLVGLHEHGVAAPEPLLDVRDVLRARGLHRVLDAELVRQHVNRHRASHVHALILMTTSTWPSSPSLWRMLSTSPICRAFFSRASR
jgi:hypothetical protein